VNSLREVSLADKPRIAHISGPNATIQNSPALVTSNKARTKYGLPPMTNPDGSAARFDVLRAQRLAAPVTVYVEQFSAHPLERDAAALYGPPDGYLDKTGAFHKTRTADADRPVYQIELRPDDGLYPLPYMARQVDGRPWEEDCAEPFGPAERARQPFYPDGSRVFEEVDRFGISNEGRGNLISAKAEIDFHRVMPPSGFTQGRNAADRTDIGDGDIPPERRGKDFFPYHPPHIAEQPPRPGLARVANGVQKILGSGKYLGAVWTQGSPRIEETVYWFNLMLDVSAPLCGNAAQRFHGMISNDGPKNIVDSVDYITSRVWADTAGRDRVGTVLIQEQQIFASRDVQKGDARPGGYVTTGGHGGIIGAAGHDGPPTLTYVPATRHTFNSEVNISRLPEATSGIRQENGRIISVPVPIKDRNGLLLEPAIPKVAIVKDGSFLHDNYDVDPKGEVDLHAMIADNLARAPLAGFVIEGLSPYGKMTSEVRHRIMARAAFLGFPVVRVGRGNNEGFSPNVPQFIGGRNLTATKARMLLMACLMKFGALPVAADPDQPTADERRALQSKLDAYQAVFDTH
jgi:hypothetical protein